VERELREERYAQMGLLDRVPRERTETDGTVRVGAGIAVEADATATAREDGGKGATGQGQPGRLGGTSTQAQRRPQALDGSLLAPSSVEPTPALSDISLPTTEEVQSPSEFLTILPRRRRPKSASSRIPPPPDSPGATRSSPPEDDGSERDDILSDCVNECLDTYPAFGDPIDPDDVPLPASPMLPNWSNNTDVPPRTPAVPYDVSGPSTVLAAHYNEIPITIDHDPPKYGINWPYQDPPRAVFGVPLSREAMSMFSDSIYFSAVKSIDKTRNEKMQMAINQAGGIRALGVDTAEIFGFIQAEKEGEVALGVQDLNLEAGTGAEVVEGQRDVPVKKLDKGKGRSREDMDDGPRREGIQSAPRKNKGKGKEVVVMSEEEMAEARRIILEKLGNLPPPFFLKTPKGKGKDKDKGKDKVPSSSRSTRSTRSTAKSFLEYAQQQLSPSTRVEQPQLSSSPSEPTPEYMSPAEKRPSPPAYSWPTCGTSDLQAVRESQIRLGSTPSIPAATLDDTPASTMVYTPFTGQSTITRETPEDTPTHRRAVRARARNQKRASEEQLQKEKKRVKDEALREKVVDKVESWKSKDIGEDDVFGTKTGE